MSIPTVHNPVPKRAHISSSPFGVTPHHNSSTGSCIFYNLEEIVNDCFENSMNILLDERRLSIVQKFEDLVNRLHCGENLNFLIEIFKYEFYLDKIIPVENGVIRERLNSITGSIISQQSKFEFPSVGIKTRSGSVSIKSIENEPTNDFVSTMDELDSHDSEANIQSVWEYLGDRIVGDEESIEFITLDDIDMATLSNQWNHIINTYILRDSPQEINLSDKVYNSIIEEHNRVSEVHNPMVLVPAKKEVLRLVRENVFLRFLNEEKKLFNGSPVCYCQNDSPNRSTSNSTQPYSPIISPTTTIKDKSNFKANKKVHTSPPISMIYNNDDDSGNYTNSSLTNLLGHLKLNSSAPPSSLHSLNNSPLQQEEKSYTAKFGKIWRKKKQNSDHK